MTLYLDSEYLQKTTSTNKEIYRTASPSPHIVLDNLLLKEAPDKVLDKILIIEYPVRRHTKPHLKVS